GSRRGERGFAMNGIGTHEVIYSARQYVPSNAAARMKIDDRGPYVFIVDGDIAVRTTLEFLIATAGWHPESFGSAEEFLSHPCGIAPCCVILDLTLPGLSGLELQQRLGSCPDVPIIFLTRHTDVPIAVQAMKAGAVEFLIKPFNNAGLLAVIAA